jgi:hypothetical protein
LSGAPVIVDPTHSSCQGYERCQSSIYKGNKNCNDHQKEGL